MSLTQNLFLLYRSKGLTEQGLASLGYTETIVFRPGFLAQTNRADRRISESIFSKITGVLSYVSSSLEIPVRRLLVWKCLVMSHFLPGLQAWEVDLPFWQAWECGSAPFSQCH